MDDRSESGDIPRERFVAGLRQAEKLIKRGVVKRVFLAHDAARQIAEKTFALCNEKGISPDTSYSMAALGKLCGIEVGCAVCVER